MTNLLNVEEAKILTISTAHLHPETIRSLELCEGEMANGPSIAIRAEGFLVNSHLGMPDALERDIAGHPGDSLLELHPDLVLVRTLARGLGATWLNIDCDGIEYTDILPTYDGDEVTIPTGDGWSSALSTIAEASSGHEMVVPDVRILEVIEAGQTPGLPETPEP